MIRGAAKREFGEIDPGMIRKMRKKPDSDGNGSGKRTEVAQRFRRMEASRRVIQNVMDVIHQSPGIDPDDPQPEDLRKE